MAWRVNTLANLDQPNAANIAQRLKTLEYAVRQSMTVREDQEEAADPQHLDEAKGCGISVEDGMTKGDLLSAVQTLMRAI
jgi:hypothetical protein